MLNSSLTHSIKLTENVIDSQAGIINRLDTVEMTGQDPKLFWVRAYPANTEPIFGNVALNQGDGVSTNRHRAIMKAVGETLERYCAANYRNEDVVISSFRDLEGLATPPSSYALFSDDQYDSFDSALKKFNEDTPVGWTRGFSLCNKTHTFVPAQFVYLPYNHSEAEVVLDNQISTGLACHATIKKAIEKGILEIIERDAFMLWWMFKTPSHKIDPSSYSNPAIVQMVSEFSRLGYEIHILSISSDFRIPVVLTALISRDNLSPRAVVGLGTSHIVEEAIVLSLEEVSLGLIGMTRNAQAHSDYTPGKNFSNVRTLDEHGLCYALDEASSDLLANCLNSTPEAEKSELAPAGMGVGIDLLTYLVTILMDNDMDILVFDLTTPDVEEAGFKVARTVIPSMLPMDIDHNLQHLGGPRVSALAAKYPDVKLPYRQPHPFP